jgi:nucleoid DNA-binding protein
VNITPVIRDLLLRHQKVVIPGFGSFMVLQKPAQLNKVTRDLTPPSVVIGFDPKQQSDDGRLTKAIRIKQQQSEATALKVIAKFIKETKDVLELNNRVTLEGLGSLTKSKSGDLEFTPEEALLKRLKMFDLPKITIPAPAPAPLPIQSQPVPQAPVSKPAPAVPTVTPIQRRKRKWIVPVSILLVLAALAAGVYYSGYYDKIRSRLERQLSGRITDEKKLTFGKRNQTDSTARADSITEAISRQLDERTSREKALSYQEPVEAHVEHADPPPLNTTTSAFAEKHYHIIAGAFLVPNNADRQKKLLERKGLHPELLPKRGDYFMVSLGSFDTQEEALKGMREIAGTWNKEMWIMKK